MMAFFPLKLIFSYQLEILVRILKDHACYFLEKQLKKQDTLSYKA